MAEIFNNEYTVVKISNLCKNTQIVKKDVTSTDALTPFVYFYGKDWQQKISGNDIPCLGGNKLDSNSYYSLLAPSYITACTSSKDKGNEINSILYYSKHYGSTYNTNNLNQLEKVNPGWKLPDACKSHEHLFVFKYNCIGYALGIADWVNPSDLGINLYSPTEDVQKAVEQVYKSYKKKVVEKPEGDLHVYNKYKEYKESGVLKADIAFYCDEDGEITHGAKFTAINQEGKEVKQWNSKWGHGEVYTHNLYGIDDLYGEPCFFLRFVTDEQSYQKDDL